MQKRDGVVICINCSKTGSADGSTDTGGDLQDDRSVGGERERYG